ncbi:MAG: hypothetical protein IKG93_07430 [Clostridiales bacterium]|nr:hypothetical protein [Clostridiales bacterium]
MIALIRAKIYPAVRSKSFRFFAAAVLVWYFVCVVSVISGASEIKNTGFAYFYVLQAYAVVVPLGASCWYGMFHTAGFDRFVSFQVNDFKSALSGIVCAMTLNTICVSFLLALSIFFINVPLRGVEKSSASDIATLFLVFAMITFVRTALTCFFTELTHSRLGGVLFGMAASSGLFDALFIDVEVGLCYILGITRSTLPIIRHTTYFIWDSLESHNTKELVMEKTNLAVVIPVLLAVFLFFSAATVVSRLRRDVA